MKVLIADDEKEARALITHFLKELHPSFTVKETNDGTTTIDCLEEENYDIVFLDIKMPGLTGLDVIKSLPSANMPAIVFTTAFGKHALTAFDNNAVDYLLKPFNKSRFAIALNKAIDYAELKVMKKQKHFLSNISIKQGTKTIVVPVSEIEFFQTKGDYISVVISACSYLLSITLNELTKSLSPEVFIRIHKSTIINTDFIKRIESHPSGDLTIVTKSDKQVRASRTYKENYKKIL